MNELDLVTRCIIIPDSIRDEVKILALSFAESTAMMWDVPLNTTGDSIDPPTHWISSGFITRQFADMLPFSHYVTEPDGTQIWVTDPYDAAAFVAIAEAMGVTPLPTVERVAWLMAQADVSDQEGLVAMERMGLKHIAPVGDI